jgi:hypothetical protein
MGRRPKYSSQKVCMVNHFMVNAFSGEIRNLTENCINLYHYPGVEVN